ncbi:GDSL esterase/lipase At5g33370-like [Coffea arabica]|uniref:GDSL esterase/lipase At5g33370-like n=1 Tax=Coffea arabica TaxID=13443 RepID=A0A6P6TJS8_COFAR|nr:GDSL esterase/lipase At4g16230-like [Coffea arabica]
MENSWLKDLGLIIAADFGSAEVPAIFIFGDSTADVGTNNYLKLELTTVIMELITLTRNQLGDSASNGFNTIDLVAIHCMHGVNFASGGSGICRETGSRPFTNVVPLGKQIEQFATVRGNMTELLGEAKTESLLANSLLYIIRVGSNDLLEYVRYDFKNKSFALHRLALSILRINSRPFVKLQLFTRWSEVFAWKCVRHSHGYLLSAILFHMKPAAGQEPFNGEDKCTPQSKLCQKRKDFFFWDWYHPTQNVSYLAANKLVYGGEADEYVTPINFNQLASI